MELIGEPAIEVLTKVRQRVLISTSGFDLHTNENSDQANQTFTPPYPALAFIARSPPSSCTNRHKSPFDFREHSALDGVELLWCE